MPLKPQSTAPGHAGGKGPAAAPAQEQAHAAASSVAGASASGSAANEAHAGDAAGASGGKAHAGAAGEEEEEEETCGFCRYMKAGPCKQVFVDWEKCVDKHRTGGDFVGACLPSTQALKACMEANPEYYGDMLEGAVEGEEEGAEDGEREAGKEGAEREEDAPAVATA